MRILHFRIALSLVIGVIGADMSNVVANMFATSNVSKEFQSIAVAIVVTMLGVSQTVGQSITSALITGFQSGPVRSFQISAEMVLVATSP